ncbi:porin [Roseateles puraquae]|uniref:porin n=1 Tax=Roseateles puraquae TaxID=431059 RepID=UPI0031DDDB96
MKKIALVAALAATAAAPAFAQSVTLWGRLNTTVESQKIGSLDRKMVLQNNNSRLGLKGSEDLGGGLKVSFNLEHGFESDTGAASGGTTFWNRQSNVELSGSFGAVRLGKWFPGSYFAVPDYVSMHNHDTGTSSDALYAYGDFPSSNKVAYFTPTVGGFSSELSVTAGEGTTKRSLDAAVNYDMGPAHAGFGYQKKGDFNQFAVRGLYEFGPLVLGGYIQRAENTFGGVKKNWNVWRASGMYVVGQSEFHLNFGKADNINVNDGAKQLTVGYNYNLSKRTKVYGFWTKVDNQAAGAYFPVSGMKAGQDFSSLAAGIRHNF